MCTRAGQVHTQVSAAQPDFGGDTLEAGVVTRARQRAGRGRAGREGPPLLFITLST